MTRWKEFKERFEAEHGPIPSPTTEEGFDLDEWAVVELQKLVDLSEGDPEIAHSQADDILCTMLVKLGFAASVRMFLDVRRWYA